MKPISCQLKMLIYRHLMKLQEETKTAKKTKRRKALGLCTRCGSPKDSEQHLACTNREKERRSRNIAAGMCRTHGKRPALSATECEECILRASAKKALGARNRWQEVKEDLDNQHRCCSYTGRKLLLGINASVDHKIPVSRGGAKSRENTHWVDKAINQLKTWLTHEEFIRLAAQIYAEKQATPPDPISQVLIEIHLHLTHPQCSSEASQHAVPRTS